MSYAPMLVSLLFTAAEPDWLNDYDKAIERACKEKKDLVIVFQKDKELDDVLRDDDVKKKLGKFICLKIPTTYKHEGKPLMEHAALADMLGKPGLMIVSYHDEKLPNYGFVISAHPIIKSRYRWAPDYGVEQVKIILELPAIASVSQRSMIYAVSVHPERPQSIHSEVHPAFLRHAEKHSQRQASMQRQHHANLGAVMNALQSQVSTPVGGASEVVAESWGRVVGGENVLEAAFSCIDAWRGSAGHWGSVSRQHRYYGYDIARGANGTWYATGIFAR
jgi:hypothetical protein